MSPTETRTEAASRPSSSSRPATPLSSPPPEASGPFRYRLFGLTLVSSRALVRLTPLSPDTEDGRRSEEVRKHTGTLSIRFADPPAELERLDDPAWRLIAPTVPTPGNENPAEEPVVRLWRHDATNDYRYRYRDGAEFFLEATGASVWARPPADMTNEDVCSYLLGPVFALVLRLRGIVCLHASAASVGEVAIAFLGCAHAGKSTLAAAFSLAGYPALSDDIATLIPEDGHFLAAADSPRLNLWPRSAELLFGDAGALPRLSDSWDKRFLEVPAGDGGAREVAGPSGQRLGALYELALAGPEQGQTRIVGLEGHQALVALTQYARAAVLLDPAHRPVELDLLADVMSTVAVRRIERATHARPQDVRDLVLEDLRELGIEPRPTRRPNQPQAGDTSPAITPPIRQDR